MSDEFVSAADAVSRPTSTSQHSAVQDPARTVSAVKIKRIRRTAREPVYNMEVTTYHNFAVNGGLVVHNSIDSVRYALERVWRRKGQ